MTYIVAGCGIRIFYLLLKDLNFFVFLFDNMSRVMKKTIFCICENKDADQLRGNREADQRLCFATRIVQSLYFLYTKFQASSHRMWLYSPVCVGPGRIPRRPVFSQRGSYFQCSIQLSITFQLHSNITIF